MIADLLLPLFFWSSFSVALGWLTDTLDRRDMERARQARIPRARVVRCHQ